jgi:hypothetical protein
LILLSIDSHNHRFHRFIKTQIPQININTDFRKDTGSRHPETTPEISQIDDLNGRMSKKNEIVSPSTMLRVVEKRDCRACLRLTRNDIG